MHKKCFEKISANSLLLFAIDSQPILRLGWAHLRPLLDTIHDILRINIHRKSHQQSINLVSIHCVHFLEALGGEVLASARVNLTMGMRHTVAGYQEAKGRTLLRQ